MFERLTNNQYSCVQNSGPKGKKSRYGLCPECDNPLLLININNPDAFPKPHGRHQLKAFPRDSESNERSKSRSTEGRGREFELSRTWKRLKAVEGFNFALEKILSCDPKDPTGVTDIGDEHLVFDVAACERRDFLVENFNLAVGILQEDTGIEVSLNLAKAALDTYFEEHWYRWRTATKGNLPWLFLRTAMTHNLYGKALRSGSNTARAILQNCPTASINAQDRLVSKPGTRLELEFGLRNHVVKRGSRKTALETIDLFVAPSAMGDVQLNTVFEKTITLRPNEFLLRVKNKQPPKGLGEKLVQLASASLEDYLNRHPEARTPNAEGQPDAS